MRQKTKDLKRAVLDYFHKNNLKTPQKILPPTANPESKDPHNNNAEYLFLLRLSSIISDQQQKYPIQISKKTNKVIHNERYINYIERQQLLKKIMKRKKELWRGWK